MIIKNGLVLNNDFKFINSDLKTNNNIIEEIASGIVSEDEIIDASNCYVVPGLIDTHMHGAVNRAFIDYLDDTYDKICGFEASMGTTTLVPAISAAKKEKLLDRIEYINRCVELEKDGCAKIRGLHLEGPFFSVKYKGAHKPENIRDTNIDEMREYCEMGGKNLKIITLAPELPDAEEVIGYAVEHGVCVSAGHTNAEYEDILNGIKWGVTQGTHLFNAMSPMNHRNPNAVGGLLYSDAKCELICDFIHIHPAVIALAYKIKGCDKINMITDSEVGAGLPDGEYFANEQKVIVKNRKATLENGTICGGSSVLLDGIKNLVSLGIPLEDACKTATKNPAETIGLYNEIGSLAKGKIADILILDKNLNLKQVILRGKKLK